MISIDRLGHLVLTVADIAVMLQVRPALESI